MECNGPSAPLNAIDLCLYDDGQGTSAEVSFNDLANLHLPSHRTFKSRKVYLIRDIGSAWTSAWNAIERGDEAITAALESYEAGSASITDDAGLVPEAGIGDGDHLPNEDEKELFAPATQTARLGGAEDPLSFESDRDLASDATALPSSPPSNLCYYCGGRLKSPCWYCIDCSSESFY